MEMSILAMRKDWSGYEKTIVLEWRTLQTKPWE